MNNYILEDVCYLYIAKCLGGESASVLTKDFVLQPHYSKYFLTSDQRLKLWYITDVRLLWLTKIFTPFQQEFVNNIRISHQQLWNVIIIAVIVFYF